MCTGDQDRKNTLSVKPKFRKVLDLSDFLIAAPLLTGGDKNVAKQGLFQLILFYAI